jgi:DNA-binding transcriptional LysR family regulator
MLLAALLDFRRRWPRVTVEVDLSTRVVDLVGESFDLAIRAGGELDGSLVARRLSSDTGVVAAAPEWVRAHGMPERPEDMAARPCALFRPRHGVARWTLRRGDDEANVDVRGPLAGTDFQFVRLAALAGAGAALLPASMAAYDVAQGRLVRLLPEWSTPGGTSHLVYPSARHLPARVRALRDHLVAWFTAPDWNAAQARCAEAMGPCPGGR